jgi:hypothetical protein
VQKKKEQSKRNNKSAETEKNRWKRNNKSAETKEFYSQKQ